MRNLLIVLAIGIAALAMAMYVDGVPDDSAQQTLDDEGDDAEEAEQNPQAENKDTPIYSEPTLSGNEYLVDSFPSLENFNKMWVSSKAENDEGGLKYEGKFTVNQPKKMIIKEDLGLVLSEPAKHYGISRKLDKMFSFTADKLIVQYNVKFQDGLDCGGAYVKLVSDEKVFNAEELNNETPYSIMFGPDKCGMDNKLHFILRYKNPKSGVYEEKHAKQPLSNLGDYFTNKNTHLYTLILNSDNTYTISVDSSIVSQGSLLTDLNPAINPNKTIADPEDKKPEEWDEREKIVDADAVKPEDWDESQPLKIVDETATQPSDWLTDETKLIDDAEAVKPDDWDNDMDGEWEPRQIDNPVCKGISGCGPWKAPEISNPLYVGVWKAPMVDNPDYKGIWEPRIIDNPNYFEDTSPFDNLNSIQAVAFELWSMSGEIMFDDLIISDDQEQVELFNKQTWDIKRKMEAKGSSYFGLSVWDVMKQNMMMIIGVTTSIVLLIVYMCMPKKMSKPDNAAAKKTDAVQPDDDEVEQSQGDSVPEEEKSQQDQTDIDDLQNEASAEQEQANDAEVIEADAVITASTSSADDNTTEDKAKEVPLSTTDDSGDGKTRHRKVQRDDLNTASQGENVRVTRSRSRGREASSKHRVNKD